MSLMPNNNEVTKKTSHKTYDSQSAGMTSGTGSTPVVALSVPPESQEVGKS